MDTKRIIRDLEREIILRNYSRQTFDSYGACLKLFGKYFTGERHKEHPVHVNMEEIKEFLVWVRRERSMPMERQCIFALRFLYGVIEGQPKKMDGVAFPKWERKIPEVVDHSILMERFAKVQDKKERALIAVLYATGMRLGEVQKLRTKDIDGVRMCIVIRLGKGGKDRIVPMDSTVYDLLKEYWRSLPTLKRGSEWVFGGEKLGNYMSDTTIYRIVKDRMKVNPHLLRHCYATFLHESGSNLKVMADILGHKHTTTTEIYTHTSLHLMRGQANPFRIAVNN